MNTKPPELSLGPDLLIGARWLDRITQPHHDGARTPLDPEKLGSLLVERFHEPLDYPSIFQSILPGDSVVIAISPDTNICSRVALAIAGMLAENGVAASDITLLIRDTPENQGFQSDQYEVVRFDPNDQTQRSYLIAGIDAEPVYVSRVMFDADVVIPIGSFHGATPRDSICPTFCDQQTSEYLLGLRANEADATINMINENLGIFWQVNVIDSPGNELVDIMVGARRRVLLECMERSEETWAMEVAGENNLVIVTLESDADQNWQNAATALLMADRIASTDGAIVLISRISDVPPANWKQGTKPGDMAGQIGSLFDQHHVYLYGNITRAAAESAGFGPIGDSDELSRLLEQYGSAVLIRDAHKVDVQLVASRGTAGIH